MRLTLSTPPAEEPLTRTDAKAHLKVTHTDEDAAIDAMIVAARAYVERITQRSLVTQTWVAKLDAFPSYGSDRYGGRIYLPKPKLQSVTSIQYVDTNGSTQTLASNQYQVVLGGEFERGNVSPAYSLTWPDTRDQQDAVTITFVAGYGTSAEVPEPIIQYLKLLVGAMHANRESEVTGTVAAKLGFAESLIAPYRRVWKVA